MLRVKRVLKSELSEAALVYAQNSRAILAELTNYLSKDVLDILPYTTIDGDYVNFETNLEGSVQEIFLNNQNDGQQFFTDNHINSTFINNRDKILNVLKTTPSFNDPNFILYKQSLIDLLEANPSILYLIAEKHPLFIPYKEIKKVVLAPAPKKAMWPYILLGILLLLLLLFLLWYFFLKPWPFNLAKEPLQHTNNVAQIDNRKAQEISDNKKDDVILPLVQEDEKKDQEEEAKKKAEIARLAEQKAYEKAQAEAIEKQKALEAEKAKQVALLKAKEAEKKEPKCVTLKKANKLPKLIMAIDNTWSMGSKDMFSNGSITTRINVATLAAKALVPQINKNIDINLLETRDCPLPIDHGTFAPTQRSKLQSIIGGMPFRMVNGGTPLVTTLLAMENISQANNNGDNIGILISDGIDTCEGTNMVNVCALANQIHQNLPKFKISVMILGQDANDISCIARITGGKVYNPNNLNEFSKQLQDASKELIEETICRD